MDIRNLLLVEPKALPQFGPGDTVRVFVKVVEGSRERIQAFEGVVIRIHRGGPGDATFTVRRIASHNVGVERTFLFQSPRIEKIEVLRYGRVRRAKLYYLRNLRGKAARIKERARPLAAKQASSAPAGAAQAAEPPAAERAEPVQTTS